MTTDADQLVFLLSFVDSHARRRALSAFDSFDTIPEAIGRIMMLGEVTIPGLVMSSLDGGSEAAIEERLDRADPFRDEVILTWLKGQGAAHPDAVSYVFLLDLLRRKALERLTA